MTDPRDGCPDCGDIDHHGCPQPDTAPDLPSVLTMLNARTRQQPGAWGAVIEAWDRDVSDTQLLAMARDALAAALNGAPATPAEP